MAAIRALEWNTEAFWQDRIRRYLDGTHSPQQALSARTAFVAADGGQLLGFVAGHQTRRLGCDGELQWINVIAESRGEGIARKLMERIGLWFAEQNMRRICVNVDPKNATARKLYAACGAQPLNEQWMLWEDSKIMCKASAKGNGPSLTPSSQADKS
jgi:GNAT superfamily N-acetyltransferase